MVNFVINVDVTRVIGAVQNAYVTSANRLPIAVVKDAQLLHLEQRYDAATGDAVVALVYKLPESGRD